MSHTGGAPEVLTTPDRQRGEGDHLWPEFLPGGQAILFTVMPSNLSPDSAQIAVLDLRTGQSKVLVRGGSHALYVPTGHLIYGAAGTLLASRFDLGRMEVVSTPVPVLNGLVTSDSGAAQFAVADNGALVYASGVAGRALVPVMSVDRQGRAEQLPGLPADRYRDVRLSPNGRRLALATITDIWVYDFESAIRSALTTDHARNMSPLWTLDGQRLVFTSYRAGYPELFRRGADGTGDEERVLTRSKDLLGVRATGWANAGVRLLFTEYPTSVLSAIGQVVIGKPSDVTILMKSGSRVDSATVSPDGRWIAYDANFSGRFEVYLESYPGLGNRQQVSAGGGTGPIWARDGRELFFGSVDRRQMLAVDVHDDASRTAPRPRVLFEFDMSPREAGNRPYDVAAGGRFVVIPAAPSAARHIVFVQHWLDELTRLVPAR